MATHLFTIVSPLLLLRSVSSPSFPDPCWLLLSSSFVVFFLNRGDICYWFSPSLPSFLRLILRPLPSSHHFLSLLSSSIPSFIPTFLFFSESLQSSHPFVSPASFHSFFPVTLFLYRSFRHFFIPANIPSFLPSTHHHSVIFFLPSAISWLISNCAPWCLTVIFYLFAVSCVVCSLKRLYSVLLRKKPGKLNVFVLVWQRHIQEMAAMASRPFATCILNVGDGTSADVSNVVVATALSRSDIRASSRRRVRFTFYLLIIIIIIILNLYSAYYRKKERRCYSKKVKNKKLL